MAGKDTGTTCPDIRVARLSKSQIDANFSDMHPALSHSEALIEADRCYFCYDAPCTTACPTDIDIPRFIQNIRSDNLIGSAQTILDENIMGGMCARVCPTEVLCEQACVRNTHVDKPVTIGQLQRHATDPVFADNIQLFERAAATGRRVAVVGGGPAGLSCAHRLACLGHHVTILNSRDKLGGLNEYGIAAYKATDEFAQREVDYILSIGAIDVQNSVALGPDLSLSSLRDQYDAVFLSIGLGGVNQLGLAKEDMSGVEDAVEYIAQLRQAEDKSTLLVGRRVLVIGGGMTAIDIATQSKRLGAQEVTIVYRRGPEQMNASQHEQHYAQTSGVQIKHWATPTRLLGDAELHGVEFEYTRLSNGKLESAGEAFVLEADVVFKAIGQTVLWNSLGDLADQIETKHGRIQVDDKRRTSLADVWAGGDCVFGGEDLTVSAVQDGKLAAMAIDAHLKGIGETDG